MQNVHPLFVHFPIALLSVSVLFDLLGQILKKDSLTVSAWWMQIMGTAALVFTAATGLIAETTVGHSDDAHEVMQNHKTMELIAAGIFLFIFIWRLILRGKTPSESGKTAHTLYTIMAIGAVAFMLTGSYWGGKLVYEYGVGVSVSQKEAPEHTSGNNKESAIIDSVKEKSSDTHKHQH